MKKLLSLALSFVMLLTTVAAVPFSAPASDLPAGLQKVTISLNDSYGDSWEGAYLEVEYAFGII